MAIIRSKPTWRCSSQSTAQLSKTVDDLSMSGNTRFLYPPSFFKQFVPQKSGLHRQAVFALYRALLSQCKIAPFDDADRDALKNITRNRFRANRHLRAPRRLKLSFYGGYRALDYIDEAVAGNKIYIERVTSYLSRIPGYLKQPLEPKLPPPKPVDPPYITPPENQFFNVFPREKVKGVRRVPIFTRANGFPMVRWKKPQPKRLSRTIRQLVQAKQKNIDQQSEYEDYRVPIAREEDYWDLLISQQTGAAKDKTEDSWSTQATAGLQYLKRLNNDRHKRTMETALKMVEIVEKEQQLAEEERAARAIAASQVNAKEM